MNARFCVMMMVALTISCSFCTRAEEGGGRGRPHQPDPRGYARTILNKADDLGLNSDQKTKLEAILTSPAPKTSDDVHSLGNRLEEIVKGFTQDQKDKLSKLHVGGMSGMGEHDNAANGDHKAGDRKEGGGASKDDNDDHK